MLPEKGKESAATQATSSSSLSSSSAVFYFIYVVLLENHFILFSSKPITLKMPSPFYPATDREEDFILMDKAIQPSSYLYLVA